MRRSDTATNPGDLFGIVDTFTSLGWHRSGSAVDSETAAWFGAELQALKMAVEHQVLPFGRWVTESRLSVGGREIDHLPLQTPWVGQVDTTDLHVTAFDPKSGGFPAIVDEPLAAAQASGAAAAVLATEHVNGSLVGVNRQPDSLDTPTFPAVLVAGRDLAACQQGPLRLVMRAHFDDKAVTNNVIARRGSSKRPVVLTTPLTGWFGCAGERGTGIAVLFDLIDRLGDTSLLVVGTGGHELSYLGGRHYLANHSIDARAVVHIGASVAVEEVDANGHRHLAPTRVAMTTLDPDQGAAVAESLERAALSLSFSAESWIGEAEVWDPVGLPMLSITGAGTDFHTPEDIPGRVTSPGALFEVAASIGDAVTQFLRWVD